jgi:hypothetical protein
MTLNSRPLGTKMTRRNTPQDTIADVLVESRRRCCICFGLNRDTSICQGQIAHLDSNPSNDKKDNLVFLCFNHHDQFDSSTRQSKNFTVLEVKKFRSELQEVIQAAFSMPVVFGNAKVFAPDELSGHYIRVFDVDSAELKIAHMPDGRYRVSGIALHGTDRAVGPNIGEVDFMANFSDGLVFKDTAHNPPYCLHLRTVNGKLEAVEEHEFGYFGVGARFGGIYERAA